MIAVAQIASAEVTYEEASTIVLEEIVRDDLGAVRILGSDTAYGEGYAIWNFKGKLIDLEDPMYFFLIDDDPTANWGHPCRYVWVEKADGSFRIQNSSSPPTIYKGPLTPPEGAPVIMLRELPQSAEAFDPSLSRPRRQNRPRREGLKNNIEQFDGLIKDIPAQHRWALIVNGGWDMANNHIRYWGDISNMYCALVQTYGYLEDHIIVCNSDGVSSGVDRSDGTDSPRDLDGDGDDDIDYAGTYTGLTSAILEFKDLTQDDFFFFFASNHGEQTGPDTCDAELCLWNYGAITDADFAARVDSTINAAIKVYVFEQCYSGGFVDDLDRVNEVVITAARCDESSYDGITPVDPVSGQNYFDEFAYEWTAAVRGCFADSVPAQPWICGTPCDADSNGDGRVDMVEAFNWAVAHDGSGDDPRFGENPTGLRRIVDLFGTTFGTTLIWVDFAHVGTEEGSFNLPFNTIAEGDSALQAGGTLVIKAGSTPETKTFDKTMNVISYGGTVTVGSSKGNGLTNGKFRQRLGGP
jgi:hypothetical protein